MSAPASTVSSNIISGHSVTLITEYNAKSLGEAENAANKGDIEAQFASGISTGTTVNSASKASSGSGSATAAAAFNASQPMLSQYKNDVQKPNSHNSAAERPKANSVSLPKK